MPRPRLDIAKYAYASAVTGPGVLIIPRARAGRRGEATIEDGKVWRAGGNPPADTSSANPAVISARVSRDHFRSDKQFSERQ